VVKNGTGKALGGGMFQIAGKTGTAQLLVNGAYKDSQKKASYQASFVGYFPADKPKYSCIVVVSAPTTGEYYGAQVAGPVFKDVADKVYAVSLDMQKSVNAPVAIAARRAPVIMSGNRADLVKVMTNIKVNNNVPIQTGDWIKLQSHDSVSVQYSVEKVEVELKKMVVPNLVGFGIRDALFLLENNGLHVKFFGSGVITKQSLEPGVRFIKGNTIELELS